MCPSGVRYCSPRVARICSVWAGSASSRSSVMRPPRCPIVAGSPARRDRYVNRSGGWGGSLLPFPPPEGGGGGGPGGVGGPVAPPLIAHRARAGDSGIGDRDRTGLADAEHELRLAAHAAH